MAGQHEGITLANNEVTAQSLQSPAHHVDLQHALECTINDSSTVNEASSSVERISGRTRDTEISFAALTLEHRYVHLFKRQLPSPIQTFLLSMARPEGVPCGPKLNRFNFRESPTAHVYTSHIRRGCINHVCSTCECR